MTIHNNLSELIGDTPLVKLHHVTDGVKATIAVKVEYFNPGGSSKDRIAERIIDAAERSGQLKPGGVIVEPTSGNTGVGLALVAQQRGYRTIFTLPDKVSESKRAVLRAYGAEVVVTPTDAGPDDPRSYYQVAERLANTIPGGFRPNQYDNPNGPLSHYYTTGPEIWEATDHKVTHFVAGIGTGGTISGTGKYLKEVSDGAVTVVGSDPEGSIYSDPSDVHQYDIEGVGEDFYPKAFDRNITDDIVQVTDREAFEMTRRLGRGGRTARRRLVRHGRRQRPENTRVSTIWTASGSRRAAAGLRPQLSGKDLQRRLDARERLWRHRRADLQAITCRTVPVRPGQTAPS